MDAGIADGLVDVAVGSVGSCDNEVVGRLDRIEEAGKGVGLIVGGFTFGTPPSSSSEISIAVPFSFD